MYMYAQYTRMTGEVELGNKIHDTKHKHNVYVQYTGEAGRYSAISIPV